MKIAIIGSGISGLGAAYLLNSKFDITVYEKNDYLGGHSRTREVSNGLETIPVDTGFIVFNDRNYPNLCALFDRLNVPVENSDMSFGVSIEDGWLEYSSYNMFAQRRNLIRPMYWNMIRNILRFNKQAMAYLEKSPDINLGDCLEELKMDRWFRDYYLLAMGAAIWSCPLQTMLDFPARTFIQFFNNHGLLTVNDHPQWKTVTGGSREYIKRLTADFKHKIQLNSGIKTVKRSANQWFLETEHGITDIYDHVVFACHADEALNMIESPASEIQTVLASFRYQNNRVVLHRDTSFMPKNKQCWSSWVYLSENSQTDCVSLSYWMNNLQNIDKSFPIFVTLNPGREPDPELVFEEHWFSHPIFNHEAVYAQARIDSIQGIDKLWFCGAYQRYGFHEDGLLSAVRLVKKLGVNIPW